MLLELKEDLVHLEGSGDGLDEDGAADGASGHAQRILTELEDVVPETSFEVVLHLGQVEVRAKASLDELFSVVEEVKTEIEQATGDGLAVDREV